MGQRPSESATVLRSYTWSTTVFGWVVRVNWPPHKCQDPRSPAEHYIVLDDQYYLLGLLVYFMLWLSCTNQH